MTVLIKEKKTSQRLLFPPKKPLNFKANGRYFLRKMNVNGGKLYASKRGLLYDGDCFDLFSVIKDDSIDLVFADPPFNLKKDYGPNAPDNMTEDAYLEWSEKWIAEAVRVLKPGGALFIYNIPRWASHFTGFLNKRMIFRHWIALSMKNTYPRGNILYPAHYALLYYTKGPSRVFHKLRTPIPACRHCGKDIKDYGGHRDKLNPKGLNLTDFWDDTSPVRHSKFKKRASNELKPIISQRAIKIATRPEDIVLDPFGGGGSTFSMAEREKRLWIGAEIETADVIIERLWDEAGVSFNEKPDGRLLQVFRAKRE